MEWLILPLDFIIYLWPRQSKTSELEKFLCLQIMILDKTSEPSNQIICLKAWLLPQGIQPIQQFPENWLCPIFQFTKLWERWLARRHPEVVQLRLHKVRRHACSVLELEESSCFMEKLALS